MFWGFSEALDLYEEYVKARRQQPDEAAVVPNEATAVASETQAAGETAEESPNCLHILLFGAGDPRHVIKTLAKRYTHRQPNGPPPALHFYMLDGFIEVVARNMALLGIALENATTMSLRCKVHLYMDVYGNALLRPSSARYLVAKAKSLRRLLTDADVLAAVAPLLHIDGLKYRERDGLENAFNFWLPREGHVFHMPEYWVARLRQQLGVRYDHREGVFDWDLNMTLKERDAQQLCSQEYRYWRETGIAYTYPEFEQCKPNRTLAASLVRNGANYVHRGYVGDMQTGPFCAYGLRTADAQLTHSQHGENDYRATDITERNLLELLHELQTGGAYVHDPELLRKYGSVKLLMGERLTWNECDADSVPANDQPWLGVPDVQLHLLSIDEVFALQAGEDGRWRQHFDVAFVGQNYFALLKESFVAVLRERGLLLLETKLWTLARREAVNEFEAQLKQYAKASGLRSVINYNALNAKNSVLRFQLASAET